MSKKGKRHLWKCMAIYVVVLIALSIIAVSCSEKQAAVPRPAAYPRVERTYDTTYTVYATQNTAHLFFARMKE